MDFNYESPITKIKQEITSQIVETEEGKLMHEVKKAIGYSIEKEELIKALQYDRGQYEKGYNDGYNANKWISVSERLPKDRELVLFSTKTGRVFEGRYFDDDTNLQWYSFRDETFAWNNVVTAWQPLPKSYKAESEE